MLMKRCFAILGIFTLLFAVSCQKEKETESTKINPSYDAETNTVKAQFVLSVSTEADQPTKTTAEYAQYQKPFLGMEAVHLLAYSLDYTNAKHGSFLYNPFKADNTPIPAARDFNLGNLFPAGAQPTRTVELALPLGANALLLYGKANKGSGSDADDLQGSVALEGKSSDITSIAFSLKPRLTSMDAFDVGAFFFSNMMTYFAISGLVNEYTFWDHQTGLEDKSYKFWWPTPQVIKDGQDKIIYSAADTLSKYYANPSDQDKASDKFGAHPEYEIALNGIDYTFYNGELSWKQLGTMYDWEFDKKTSTKSDELATTKSGVKYALSPLGENMGYAYSVLTTIKKKGTLEELRAGSAAAEKRVLEDLYAVIERCAAATSTGWEEAVARLLALEVKSRMENYVKVYADGFDFIRTADGKPNVAALKDAVSISCEPGKWKAVSALFDIHFNESYFETEDNKGFPLNLGLPGGAAILACVRTENQKEVDRFNYNKNIPAYGFGTDVAFPIANYRYPAELMYYGNSAIRTSADVKKASDYPSSINLWNNELQWQSSWSKFASVKSDTRSVAMINNINYGTALLQSKVKFGASTLKDNREACTGEEDNQIATSYADSNKGIFVTGVIVGGQADVVGWNYTRRPLNASSAAIAYNPATKKFENMVFKNETDSNEFDKLVYDKVLSPYKVGSTEEPLYTMVWDNYDATKAADDQSDVYVGLELLNNTDDDFWGEMNLIRKGGVFYLIGKLDLAAAIAKARETNASAFTDLDRDYDCYPPYDNNGNTVNAPRVFMQDYITIANLTLGEDCLKHAYVTVPDLRSSQISLGLSIDMSWTTGLTFDVDMGKME